MARAPRRHENIEADGYHLTYYPGFLRGATVRVEGGEPVVLYEQRKPYDIRNRPNEPFTKFKLGLKGGPNDRDVSFEIHDPQHSIAEIVVRFHPRGHTPGGKEQSDPDETATFDNTAVLCPPICDPDVAKPSPERPRKPRKG